MTVFTHPLKWPEGWGRAPHRTTAQFGKGEQKYNESGEPTYIVRVDLTMQEAAKRVRYELSRLGVSEDDCMISTALRVNMAGLPRGDQGEPSDPGVAVYWTPKGKTETKVMAIDRYTRVRDNLAAVAKTLEAMRAIERHGGAQILERAFTGFDALPPPKGWREILNMPVDGSLETAERQYRHLARKHHPDAGGDAGQFAEVAGAIAQARKELGNG